MPPKRANKGADNQKVTLQVLRKRTQANAAESGSEQLRAIAKEFAKNPYGVLDHKENRRACTRSDHARKKNCAGDPFCLYGLGELKNGIWAAEPAVFSTLGPDLRKSDRRSEDAQRGDPTELTSDFTQPLGLRNLGATCYLNALMQCLFHNKPFRHSVYHTDRKAWADANMADVMFELQKAFAHMQWGNKSVYDLTYFTKRLGLQTQEQQDPQEFNKLFLSKLEEMVKGTVSGKRKRNKQEAGPVCVTDVFRGQQKYVTKCLECLHESGTDTPFYELELPVEGSASLQQSLEAYLAVESLTQENQYACSQCGHKTDAERAAVISEAPEVLLLQLMRYVYDRATWTKKKLKNEINFDNTIQLNGREYHLAAILYHKGSTAYGGHYVAEILDWETDRWWLFDDEVVTSSAPPSATVPEIVVIDDAEAKEAADDDGVEEPRAEGEADDDDFESNAQGKKRKQAASSSSSSSPRSNDTAKPKRKKKQNKEGFNRLKDAYMFAYVLDSVIHKWRHEPIDAADDVKDEVRDGNLKFLTEFGSYQQSRNDLEDKITHRKRLYDSLFLGPKATARVNGDSEDLEFTLLPTKWLQQWITGTVILDRKSVAEKSKRDEHDPSQPVVDLCAEACSSTEMKQSETIVIDETNSSPDPEAALFTGDITNIHYLCPHGVGLSPSFVGQFKAITNEAYKQIVQGSWPDSDDPFLGPIGVDLELTSQNYQCRECVKDAHNRSLEVADTTARYEQLLADIVNHTIGEDVSIEVKNVYLLASRWVADLKKHTEQLIRHTKKASEMITQGKTDNQTLLNFFTTAQDNAGSNDEKLKLTPIDERVNTALLCPHGVLAPKARQKRHRTITGDCWHNIVRMFPDAIAIPNASECCPVCQAEDAADISLRRKLRDEKAMDLQEKSLISLTKERLYPLIFEKPDFVQVPHTYADSVDARFYLIDKAWLSSWRHYHSDAHAPTPAEITNHKLRCQHGCPLVPPALASLLVTGNWDDSAAGGLPDSELITSPQWHALMGLYGPRGIKIVGEQEPNSGDFGDDGEYKAVEQPFEAVLTHDGQAWVWDPHPCDVCIHAACTQAETERRTFTNGIVRIAKLRRGQEPPIGGTRVTGTQRRTRAAGQFTGVPASASDTLALFKLKIFQELGVEPNRQKLYFGAEELTDPTRTLAQLGIRADDQLYLQEKTSDEVDEDGVTDMWTYSHLGGNETGFQGTLLGGARPAAAAPPEHNAMQRDEAMSQPVQVEIPKELVGQLTLMGFEEAAAMQALDATGANLDRALEMLLKSVS